MPGARVESTDRVALRSVEPEDAAFLQRGYANPELRDPLGRGLRTVSQVEARIEELADSGTTEQYLICLEGEASPPDRPGDGGVTPVGVFLARDVTSRPNIAIWLAPEHQGNGYATEGAALAITSIFRRYAVPSIGAGVYEFNEASRALLESLGFQQEGRQRRYEFHDGEYHDNLKYGLLREEWAEQPHP